ncbi:TetR/AcrR family transcriptional regulator [Kribbella sp. NPDC055071]
MTTTRGRIDKRQAILAAAFTVFARDGYRQTTLDAVAASARVAKHTIYNHFDDKQTLFRAAVVALAEDARARNLAVLEDLRPDRDPVQALTEVGIRLAECYCDERSFALRRLLQAELTNLPDLPGLVDAHATGPINAALADRLARLAVAGRLRLTDPDVAAEQFGALLCGPLESRSQLGTRTIPPAEQAEVATNAVRTFLRAFGNE